MIMIRITDLTVKIYMKILLEYFNNKYETNLPLI